MPQVRLDVLDRPMLCAWVAIVRRRIWKFSHSIPNFFARGPSTR
jgi:hypothetical protein